jgi:hypothetical protein
MPKKAASKSIEVTSGGNADVDVILQELDDELPTSETVLLEMEAGMAALEKHAALVAAAQQAEAAEAGDE